METVDANPELSTPDDPHPPAIRVSFTWSRLLLRVCGIAYDIDAPTLADHRWQSRLYDAFSITIITAFGSVAILQCYSVYHSQGNFRRQLDSTYILIHALAKLAYATLFFAYRDRFYALIGKTKILYPNQILVKYNFKMDYKVYKSLGLVFVILGSLTSLQWALTPLVENTDADKWNHETSPVFGTLYPLDAERRPRAKLFFDIYETAALAYDSVVGFGFYGLLYALIGHLCTGIQTLADELKRVNSGRRMLMPTRTHPKSCARKKAVAEAHTRDGLELNAVADAFVNTILPALHSLDVESRGAASRESTEASASRAEEADEEAAVEVNQILVERALVGCVRQHQAIVKYANELSHLCHPILLIQSYVFKGAFSILAVQVVVHTHDFDKEFKFYSTLVVYSIMLYMYCWIGDTLREKSSGISDVVYSCNWYDWSSAAKMHVRMVMLRAQRPLQLMAGKMFPISLHMFLTIINTSYSIFDVLRHLNDRFNIYEEARVETWRH